MKGRIGLMYFQAYFFRPIITHKCGENTNNGVENTNNGTGYRFSSADFYMGMGYEFGVLTDFRV